MKTERLSADPQGIARAAALLRAGQLVAIPTETVYGLAGDASSGAAVAQIYAAKGRPSFNPLIVHLGDSVAAQTVARWSDQADALARAFWPGPLTMVLPLRDDAGIASLTTAGQQSVALRVPGHPVAQSVLRAFGGALAAPSANRSGRISPTSADHVLDAEAGLNGRIAAVLDAGPCPVGVESTIIGWRGGQPALLRPGGIAREEIEAVLGLSLSLPEAMPDQPDAPGQLLSHYAPRASLRLNVRTPHDHESYLAFGSPGPLSLSATGDLAEAAANLFDRLHQADREGRPIAVAPIPETGLGLAINDRLRRAAAPRD